MRSVWFPAVAAVVFTAAVPPATAQNSDKNRYAFGVGMGVLGREIEGAYHLNDDWSIRVAGNYSRFEMPGWLSFASNLAGVPYDYDLRLASIGMLADYHLLGTPRGGNALVLTGGLFYNANRFDLVVTPTGNLTIGGVSYTPTDIGTLTADVDPARSFSPYIGVGFETNLYTGFPVSFYSRAGFLFQGAFDVQMATTGVGVAPAELAAEEAQLENALGFLQTLPVVSAGIRIRF